MTTSVAFLSDLVLISGYLFSLLLCVVLMLHKLPALDIPVHLVHATLLDCALFLNFLIEALLTIIVGEILRVTVQGAGEVRRLWIWVIQLCVIDELVIHTNVLCHPLLVRHIVTMCFSAHS